MATDATADDQIARFVADLTLLYDPHADAAPLLLAVSGGPDSMAMLTLAAAAFPGRIAVATVDHGLRPEAADEVRMVADHCAQLGVPHHALRPETPIAGASIQSQARDVRYALLAAQARAIGAAAILTDAKGAAMAPADAILVVAEDPRETLARAAALWFGAQPATMVAVTGTNGKTSTATFCRQIWTLLGHAAINIDAGERTLEAMHVVAGAARAAQAAGDERMDHHRVADGDMADRGTDRMHPAAILMAERIGQRYVGLFLPLAFDDVQVGAAKAGAADLDDHVMRIGDLGIVDFVECRPLVITVQAYCFHDYFFSSV